MIDSFIDPSLNNRVTNLEIHSKRTKRDMAVIFNSRTEKNAQKGKNDSKYQA